MATEKRLIWDEDAKRRIIALAVGHHTDTLPLDMIINAILHQTTTVDAVEVVHGHWKYGTRAAVCSECGFERSLDDNFGAAIACPNCGAKMDGGNEDD